MNGLSSLRCAVLGGGGFIGTNLCRALSGCVRSVRGFGRRKAFPEALDHIEWVSGDFLQVEEIAASITGCDVVYHLVTTSTPGSANRDMVADLQANVVSTLRLLDACRAEGVRRVVFVSSGGTVYGMPKELPTPESAATAPITAYGVSKLAIERYLALYEHLYGLEYRVLRVANAYGPFQMAMKDQGVVAAFLRRMQAGLEIELWGDGSVTRDYVFVDDIVEALKLAAVHEGRSRIFNIGSGQGRTLLDVVRSIERVVGGAARIRRHPARPIDVPVSVLDIRLAAAELGWQPTTTFGDGLSRTAAWLNETVEC